MTAYDGYACNFLNGQIHQVIVREDEAYEFHRWATSDDHRAGELQIGPVPVVSYAMFGLDTVHNIKDTVWHNGMLQLIKETLAGTSTNPGVGCRKQMYINIEMQPTFQIVGYKEMTGRPILEQITTISNSGHPDIIKEPITMFRTDSMAQFRPAIPTTFCSSIRAMEVPITRPPMIRYITKVSSSLVGHFYSYTYGAIGIMKEM